MVLGAVVRLSTESRRSTRMVSPGTSRLTTRPAARTCSRSTPAACSAGVTAASLTSTTNGVVVPRSRPYRSGATEGTRAANAVESRLATLTTARGPASRIARPTWPELVGRALR